MLAIDGQSAATRRAVAERHNEEMRALDREIAIERFDLEQEASEKSIGQKATEAAEFIKNTNDQIEAMGKFFDRLKKVKGLEEGLSKVSKVLSKSFGGVTSSMWDAVKASVAWIAAQVAMIAKTIAMAAVTAAKAVAGIPFIGPGLAIAAAAAVAIGLKNVIKGFHAPGNDAVAKQWGIDAGRNFMEGLEQETGVPQFGERVVGSLRGADTVAAPAAGPITQTITIMAGNRPISELMDEIEEYARINGTTVMTSDVEALL